MERFILSFRTHSETKWSRNEIFIVLESFHRYNYAMHCIMKWHPNEDKMTPEWYKNENGQNYHFQACRQWSPRVAKGRQVSPRFKGDPMDGWDELKPDQSYLSHFQPWYSKSGQFPIEIPIKNTLNTKIFPQNDILLSITLKKIVTSYNPTVWVVKRAKLN